MRVRLRVRATGVCIVHGLEDGPGGSTDDPWEDVEDGPVLDGPPEDSDVPGDHPVRGVMGERLRSTGGVQESSDWVSSSSSSSPDSSLEMIYSDSVGEGLHRCSSSLAVTASPTQKI